MKIYVVKSNNGQLYGAYTTKKAAAAAAKKVTESLEMSGSYCTATVKTLTLEGIE